MTILHTIPNREYNVVLATSWCFAPQAAAKPRHLHSNYIDNTGSDSISSCFLSVIRFSRLIHQFGEWNPAIGPPRKAKYLQYRKLTRI